MAQRAYKDLLPAGNNDMFLRGEVQQLLIGMLRFSQCMRSTGYRTARTPRSMPGAALFPAEFKRFHSPGALGSDH